MEYPRRRNLRLFLVVRIAELALSDPGLGIGVRHAAFEFGQPAGDRGQRDLENGDAIFQRFNGKKDGTLWYYRALAEAFRKAGSNPLVEEYDRVVTEFERVSGSDSKA